MMGWMVSIPPKNPLWCCWFSPGWPGVDVATENRSFRGWGEGFTVESQQSQKKRPRLAEILHSPVILEKKYEGQQKSGFKKKPKLWSKWKKWEERWEELVPFGAFFFPLKTTKSCEVAQAAEHWWMQLLQLGQLMGDQKLQLYAQEMRFWKLDLFFKGRRCIFCSPVDFLLFVNDFHNFRGWYKALCEAHVMLKHDMFSVTVWPCFDQCKPNS